MVRSEEPPLPSDLENYTSEDITRFVDWIIQGQEASSGECLTRDAREALAKLLHDYVRDLTQVYIRELLRQRSA